MVSISGRSYAQKFPLGVKGGALLSWAHFGEKEDKEKFGSRAKVGYTAGALVNFPLKNRYEFQAEGGFSKKGSKIKFNDNTWTNTATYNMIDLSMCLRKSFAFHIKENLPADWFINIGPEISYILNGKGNISVEGLGYDYTILFNKDSTNDYNYMNYFHANRWLFGLGVGVGFKFPIRPKQHLVIELRFVSGHTYLGKKGTGLPTTNPDQGYSFINILGYEDTLKTNIKTFSITVA